jgi:molybdopterin-containing oxidoreductase family membrane subunit
VRTSIVPLFLISMVVLVGMWIERYVIIIISLSRDFLPSSWGIYSGTVWDWSALAGSCGLFVTMMFLFIRVLPMIAIAEMRKMLPQAAPNEAAVHEELPCR